MGPKADLPALFSQWINPGMAANEWLRANRIVKIRAKKTRHQPGF
jgi:hypothetical protein